MRVHALGEVVSLVALFEVEAAIDLPTSVLAFDSGRQDPSFFLGNGDIGVGGGTHRACDRLSENCRFARPRGWVFDFHCGQRLAQGEVLIGPSEDSRRSTLRTYCDVSHRKRSHAKCRDQVAPDRRSSAPRYRTLGGLGRRRRKTVDQRPVRFESGPDSNLGKPVFISGTAAESDDT